MCGRKREWIETGRTHAERINDGRGDARCGVRLKKKRMGRLLKSGAGRYGEK